MDFIIAILAGFGLIVYGIMSGGDILGFIDGGSLFITVGGTIASIVASFPMSVLKKVPAHMKIIISKNKNKPMECIETTIELAMDARKQGLLVLEDKAKALEDPFFRNGIMLIVDAIEESKARQMLEGDLAYLTQRHEEAMSIYQKGAGFAPAFGMIGTLIGLINMLAGLDLDGGASTIGQGMSVALLTTLYGSILANLIFMPIANKLEARHNEELLCKEIIIEGIISIQAGENPKYIREKLTAFLEQKQREGAENAGEGSKKEKKPKKGKK